MSFNMKIETLLEARIKLKKIHHVLEFNQSQWLKEHVEFNTKKEYKQKKMVRKMEKHCTN